MRYKFILFLVVLFSVVFSCQEETPLTFKAVNVTANNTDIAEINIIEATGNETVSNNINSQITKTVVSALHIGDPDSKTETSIEESISNFNNAFEAFKAEFPETPQVWEAQIDGEVMYQSPYVVSIAMTSYTNTGGAHGMVVVSFLNFDVKTGNLIENDALINDLSAFKELAKTYFNQEIEGNRDLYFEPENFTLPANIGFNDDGLILLYNSYEIAPYSTGLTEFTIPYETIEGYLNFK